jgi:uncharacterized damage-inducible protein DinB
MRCSAERELAASIIDQCKGLGSRRKALQQSFVFNLTTYHRGQLASKLKCLGIQEAETDLVYWAKESGLEQEVP